MSLNALGAAIPQSSLVRGHTSDFGCNSCAPYAHDSAARQIGDNSSKSNPFLASLADVSRGGAHNTDEYENEERKKFVDEMDRMFATRISDMIRRGLKEFWVKWCCEEERSPECSSPVHKLEEELEVTLEIAPRVLVEQEDASAPVEHDSTRPGIKKTWGGDSVFVRGNREISGH
ncbi:hypothetical protein B0H19DRAFT_1228169 [Mycena capillaripes]|nr:hypothetical protein B0H19DRAFT_1228169 [Mycena capillaripes]